MARCDAAQAVSFAFAGQLSWGCTEQRYLFAGDPIATPANLARSAAAMPALLQPAAVPSALAAFRPRARPQSVRLAARTALAAQGELGSEQGAVPPPPPPLPHCRWSATLCPAPPLLRAATAQQQVALAFHPSSDTTISFPLRADEAQKLAAALTGVMQTFAEKQSAERPKRWPSMEYKFKGGWVAWWAGKHAHEPCRWAAHGRPKPGVRLTRLPHPTHQQATPLPARWSCWRWCATPTRTSPPLTRARSSRSARQAACGSPQRAS